MALPVIPDIFRCTFLWNRFGGVMPRNVLHVRCPSGGIASVASAFVHALALPMFDGMMTGHSFNTVAVLPLDGTSSTTYVTVPTMHGTISSGDFIAQSCCIISLHTEKRGPAHRGRVYLGPWAESETSNGIVGDAASVQTAWGTFRDAIFSDSDAVHLCVASYKHSTSEDVVDIIARNVAGTQRRRLNQLR